MPHCLQMISALADYSPGRRKNLVLIPHRYARHPVQQRFGQSVISHKRIHPRHNQYACGHLRHVVRKIDRVRRMDAMSDTFFEIAI